MPSAPHPDPPQRLARALEGHPEPAVAARWLAELPELRERALAHWGLTAERVVSPGGRGSLVVLVRRADGTPAALKLATPVGGTAREAAAREAAALAHWDGRGAVRLLDARPDDGALLLERLHGEVSLRSLAEAKATLEATSALRRLWVAPPEGHAFETVEKHTAAGAERVRAGADADVRPLVDEALAARAALVADPAEAVLLHGDFRQGAVLASDTGRTPWLAAGPEPLVGERAYDLARLARDRLHDLMASGGAAAIARRRLGKLADALDVDRERLRGWTRYRAVESGVRHLARGRRAEGEALLEFAGWL
ncbi:aminoglycoside phosphotransferase family protein [Streptomyces sp. Z26]|uniref:aminoglycoside phosphotransferase family protein n=1 Tax=Streptomyces sp. Z26 TaxID=2500177 RepID=UPI000EF15151|nr:aminoglycoside phosphotransferase family protein [Streptomyces sp. Z26]RLL69134.1 kinase [Streptomyces sp. Z26]